MPADSATESVIFDVINEDFCVCEECASPNRTAMTRIEDHVIGDVRVDLRVRTVGGWVEVGGSGGGREGGGGGGGGRGGR